MNYQENNIELTIEKEKEIELEVDDFVKVTTDNYEDLKHKPSINNVELSGNKSSEELGLTALDKYNLEQQAQDNKIALNAKRFNNYYTASQIDSQQKLQDDNVAKLKQELIDDQTRQDNIMINFELEQAEIDRRQDRNLEDYKQAQLYKNNEQDKNIQDNALGLLEKLDEDTYTKDQLAVVNAIKDVAGAVETNRQEFESEVKRVEDLANTKAEIDDLKLSNETVLSSLETVERIACSKTFKGAKVTIEPIEDYPMTVTARIEAVRRDDGYYVGWQNVDITQDNGGTHKEYNQDLNKPCFGGIFEFNKGKLTQTSESITLNGSENWLSVSLPNGRKHMFTLSGAVTNSSNDLTTQKCNNYDVVPEVNPHANGVYIQNNVINIGGAIAEQYSTVDEWKSYLATNNLQFVYGLATNEIEFYQPQIIKGTYGLNTLYANSGDIEVTTKLVACGGGITGIKVNGELLTPNDEVVNIEVITTEEVGLMIAEAVAQVGEFEIVNSLPPVGRPKTIYLVPIGVPSENNGYTEYIYLKTGNWENVGSTNIDLSGYLQKTDIVDVTGTATDKVMSQKAVTEELDKKATKEELKEYAKATDILTIDEVNSEIDKRGYKTENEIKDIEVNNAKAAINATTAGNALNLGGIAASDYALAAELVTLMNEPSEIALNINTALIKGWYKVNETSNGIPNGVKTGFLHVLEYDNDTRTCLQLIYDLNRMILFARNVVNAQPNATWNVLPIINDGNDQTSRDSIISTYSAKHIEDILSSPQYTTLKVRVEKQGESNYTADYNDNDIRNYFNAGGDVVLRYENQEFSFDKYLAGTGAIFNYNEITASSATRIKIVVKYDKSVEVTREQLAMPEVKEPKAVRAKVTTTGWNALQGKQHYALYVPGLTATDNVIISIATDNTSSAYEMASGMNLKPISQSIDTIQFIADSVPTEEFYLALLIL